MAATTSTPSCDLIHLHRMDYDICLAGTGAVSERGMEPTDDRGGRGTHNRITDEEEFERWFYEDSGAVGVEIVLERIPTSWRGLF